MKDLDLFLQESNNIEDVWDDQSFKQAKKAWNYLIKQDKLTPENICRMQGILSKYLLEEKYSGKFRDCAVWIGGREGRPWYAIPSLIENWCKKANESKNEEDIQMDHILYERIHPFLDTNGRSGRILLNWQRVKNNLPILVIYNDKKWDYYKWFN